MRKLTTRIGELKLCSTSDKKAILDLSIPKSGLLSIVIQDHLGRPRFEKEFQLDENECEISFSIPPSLSPGKYHAWITFGDKTAIRSFSIKQSKTGFNLAKWMTLFS